MKFSSVEPYSTPDIERTPLADSAGQPIGINHEGGEGGFFARIVFQDQTTPWRYAFIQQIRAYDASFNDGDVSWIDCNSGVQANGQALSDPPAGEQSVWNIGDEAPGVPYAQAYTVNPTTDITDPDYGVQTQEDIPEGTVYLWANEQNHCPNVPYNAIVWMRKGESYVDPGTGVWQCDYKFCWSMPVFAKITGQNKTSPSDISGNGDYQWIEVYRQRQLYNGNPQRLGWADMPNGRSGGATSPAREMNGRLVPTGTIVILIPGAVIQYNSNGTVYSQEWLFQYAGQEQTGDYTVNGSGGTGTSWYATFEESQETDGVEINPLNNTQLWFTQAGQWQVTLQVDIYDNGGSNTTPQTLKANLNINGGSPTPANQLFMGCGVNSGLILNTLLLIDDSLLVGGPSGGVCVVTIEFTVTTNGGYSPTDIIVNDGEITVRPA